MSFFVFFALLPESTNDAKASGSSIVSAHCCHASCNEDLASLLLTGMNLDLSLHDRPRW